jgi:hypothetical protein
MKRILFIYKSFPIASFQLASPDEQRNRKNMHHAFVIKKFLVPSVTRLLIIAVSIDTAAMSFGANDRALRLFSGRVEVYLTWRFLVSANPLQLEGT